MGSLLYLVFIGSLLSYSAYVFALNNLPPSLVSIYAYINPIVAVILGWLILQEKLNWLMGVSCMVTLLGVYLVNKAFNKQKVMNAANDIRILSWHPSYQPHFERLNKAWISKFFRLEPVDVAVLEDPYQHIIAPGGDIVFVAIGNEIVGTVAYRPESADTVEMTKMAVDERFQGRKLGWALGKAILERAAEKGFAKMVLYSSRKLAPAINMYHKLGFEEVEVGKWNTSVVILRWHYPCSNRRWRSWRGN